ncbi:hypothetical protein ACFLZ7_03620 [Nanoarchaeota archaeon]
MTEPKKEVIVREKRVRRDYLSNKALYVVVGIILFYTLTAATVDSQIVEETKIVKDPIQEKVIVEKTVTVQEEYVELIPISKEGCDNYDYKWDALPDKETLALLKGDSFADEETGYNYITCNFTAVNLEKEAGDFTFYSRDCCEQTKEVPGEGSISFQWVHKLTDPGDNFCHIKINNAKHPKIYKCLETADTVYEQKTRYREVTKKQNVTEYRNTGEYEKVEKLINATKYTYTNRVFGYNQFFYLGY